MPFGQSVEIGAGAGVHAKKHYLRRVGEQEALQLQQEGECED